MYRKKNSIFQHIKEKTFFKHLKRRHLYRSLMKVGYKLSDKEFILRLGKIRLGYELNLESPKNFNEKLNWIKLYDRKDIYTTMSDKYRMKDFVSLKLSGGGYTNMLCL